MLLGASGSQGVLASCSLKHQALAAQLELPPHPGPLKQAPPGKEGTPCRGPQLSGDHQGRGCSVGPWVLDCLAFTLHVT